MYTCVYIHIYMNYFWGSSEQKRNFPACSWEGSLKRAHCAPETLTGRRGGGGRGVTGLRPLQAAAGRRGPYPAWRAAGPRRAGWRPAPGRCQGGWLSWRARGSAWWARPPPGPAASAPGTAPLLPPASPHTGPVGRTYGTMTAGSGCSLSLWKTVREPGYFSLSGCRG